MDKTENKEIFFNRAEIKDAERISCENCFESTVFLMKDKSHEFSVGLSTILQCIEFAIQQGVEKHFILGIICRNPAI